MNIEQLLKIAIKSEINAANNYKKMADKTKIVFLKDKLTFLANEERGHRNLLEKLYQSKFPHEKLKLDVEMEKPLPQLRINDDMAISEMLTQAMDAEKKASSFYKDMEQTLEKEEEKSMARYLSHMEESHYYLLKSELELAHNFELYDEVHMMMHVGP
jgi:rubrerythrin